MNPPPSLTPAEVSGAAQLHVTAADEESAVSVHDCWNQIGVNGSARCRELVRYVHCRNCPVYSAAALQLLDRPVTEEQRREWTARYAPGHHISTPARISLVVFQVSGEWLALPTPAFQEVAERRRIHSLPHRRDGVVLGLVNVRGELLVCASLGRLLGIEAKADKPPAESPNNSALGSSRLLVTIWDGKRIVFPVDEILGIQRINEAELHEPPATVTHAVNRCCRGVVAWRDRTVGVLDAEVLFSVLNRKLA